jgi:hypothetical protein
MEAADISRKASLPPAADYKFEFAKDFQLPVGVEWSWDTVDAQTNTAVRQWAHANGISQESLSQLLGLYASDRIGEGQRIATAKAAELGKLGPNANTRVDAIGTWLEAMTGEDAKAFRTVLAQAPMASTVKMFETLMRSFISQGVTGNPGASRDGAGSQPEKISDAEYAKLTYAEKQAYAAKFDQSRFNGRGP